uniref:Cytochrome b6-f complex subunit VI n=1 Tax=Cymbidium goeringii TaxID=112607 RepID=A0A0S1YC30_9ASPA|nr:cytochrome b6-f complex subunit VI [Cymbidium goeringii]ALM87861.1 cytochrome b6-f complex subunit VI [Cymbidium goeringii]
MPILTSYFGFLLAASTITPAIFDWFEQVFDLFEINEIQ